LVKFNFGDDKAKPFKYDIGKCPGLKLKVQWSWRWEILNLNGSWIFAYFLLIHLHCINNRKEIWGLRFSPSINWFLFVYIFYILTIHGEPREKMLFPAEDVSCSLWWHWDLKRNLNCNINFFNTYTKDPQIMGLLLEVYSHDCLCLYVILTQISGQNWKHF
jgi:hypothetical protein